MSEPDPDERPERPLTRLERAGDAFAFASGVAGCAVLALALIFAIVVLIPGLAVSRSAAYDAARRAVTSHPKVRFMLGDDEVSCERIPRAYRIDGDRAKFQFLVLVEPLGPRDDGTARWADAELRRDAAGVWHVTSASLTVHHSKEKKAGEPFVLVRGDAASVSSGK